MLYTDAYIVNSVCWYSTEKCALDIHLVESIILVDRGRCLINISICGYHIADTLQSSEEMETRIYSRLGTRKYFFAGNIDSS